jgi:SAM-dependent methyltransferase
MPEVRTSPWGTFEDRRLSGPIGDLVVSAQARALANFVGRIHERDIVAVGEGSERAAQLFARGGAFVTAVQPTVAMLADARRRAEAEPLKMQFVCAGADALRFPAGAFDVAVGLHLLAHAPEWRRCVAELCRVARRLVIVDYYSAMSASLPVSLARRSLGAVGVHAATYRVFARGTIDEAFDREGFRVRSVQRQFVLPLALHQAIGSRRFTVKSEKFLDRLGLLKHFGTPIMLVAERGAPLHGPAADLAAGRRR